MARRLLTAVVLVACLVAAGSAAAAGPRTAKKPAALGRKLNVVLILSDDERLGGER